MKSTATLLALCANGMRQDSHKLLVRGEERLPGCWHLGPRDLAKEKTLGDTNTSSTLALPAPKAEAFGGRLAIQVYLTRDLGWKRTGDTFKPAPGSARGRWHSWLESR